MPKHKMNIHKDDYSALLFFILLIFLGPLGFILGLLILMEENRDR